MDSQEQLHHIPSCVADFTLLGSALLLGGREPQGKLVCQVSSACGIGPDSVRPLQALQLLVAPVLHDGKDVSCFFAKHASLHDSS